MVLKVYPDEVLPAVWLLCVNIQRRRSWQGSCLCEPCASGSQKEGECGMNRLQDLKRLSFSQTSGPPLLLFLFHPCFFKRWEKIIFDFCLASWHHQSTDGVEMSTHAEWLLLSAQRWRKCSPPSVGHQRDMTPGRTQGWLASDRPQPLLPWCWFQLWRCSLLTLQGWAWPTSFLFLPFTLPRGKKVGQKVKVLVAQSCPTLLWPHGL